MTATDGNARRTQSVQDARKRLAEKKATRSYRAPRGNQQLDRKATDQSRDKLELVFG